MSSLGDKDVFPTPQLKNAGEGEPFVCMAGPGMTVREYMAMEMCKGLIANPITAGYSLRQLSIQAAQQADDLIDLLNNYGEGEVPDDENETTSLTQRSAPG